MSVQEKTKSVSLERWHLRIENVPAVFVLRLQQKVEINAAILLYKTEYKTYSI